MLPTRHCHAYHQAGGKKTTTLPPFYPGTTFQPPPVLVVWTTGKKAVLAPRLGRAQPPATGTTPAYGTSHPPLLDRRAAARAHAALPGVRKERARCILPKAWPATFPHCHYTPITTSS